MSARAMAVVTGIGSVVLEADESCNSTAYLRERKSRKYLGLQDELAVVSAGRALEQAGLWGKVPPERTGLFLAVGYIPFLERDVDPVVAGSLDGSGRFSLPRFAADGYQRAHPLLAFRCLPNMPAYHVAASFGIEGPYYVAYPSAGQLYLALEQALAALEEDRIDVALVLGVAHQRNFLVEHHMQRVEPPVARERLRDAGAALVLERPSHAEERGVSPLGVLADFELGYRAFAPLSAMPARAESVEGEGTRAANALVSDFELGAGSPIAALASAWRAGARHVVHRLRSRDGILGRSEWLKNPEPRP